MIILHVKSGHKIIGFIAITDSGSALCEDDAFMVAGSKTLMDKLIATQLLSGDETKYTAKKVRFAEITNEINIGTPYSFDKISYERMEDLLEVNNIVCSSGKILVEEGRFVKITSFDLLR